MSVILYILAILISFNHGLLILGLKRMGLLGKHLPSAFLSVGLIAVNITAIIMKNWEILVLGFIVHCIWVFVELIRNGIKKNKPATFLIPINLLTIVGSLIAFSTESWYFFIITYCVYWLLTHFVGKKTVTRQFKSQKV